MSSTLSLTTLTELWNLASLVSGQSPSSTIIFHANDHLFHKIGIQIACLLCFCTDASRGGAVEVRDFKKRAKEGKRYILSSLGLDKLVYETINLTSYIYISPLTTETS